MPSYFSLFIYSRMTALNVWSYETQCLGCAAHQHSYKHVAEMKDTEGDARQGSKRKMEPAHCKSLSIASHLLTLC